MDDVWEILHGLNPYSATDTNAANNLNAIVDDFVLSTVVTNTMRSRAKLAAFICSFGIRRRFSTALGFPTQKIS